MEQHALRVVSTSLAAASARVRFARPGGERREHPRLETIRGSVLPHSAVAMLALDGGARTDPEHWTAGQSARVCLHRGSEPGLWPGEVPAGAQFRNDLANVGVAIEIAGSFSRSSLLSIRPLCLL